MKGALQYPCNHASEHVTVHIGALSVCVCMGVGVYGCVVPSEQLFEVVWQVRTSSVARVHGDEDGHVWIDLDILANQLHSNWLGTGTS